MTSSIIRGGANPSDLSVGQRVLFELPWHIATFILRVMYGFKVEGAELMPREGPFILVTNEHSPIAFLITGWIAIVALKQAFRRNPETISFLREELFDFPFFRSALNDKTPGRYAALTPVSAGRLALGLMEAYRILQNGGIVVLNPEGDMPWDGRPLPIGHALAWLALHTGAPVVPAIISMGAYDIWPRWQTRLNLKGKVRLRIGQPFRLSEAPLERVTNDDMTAAEQVMRPRFDQLLYDSGDKAKWSGVPTRDGVPLPQPPVISPPTTPLRDRAAGRQVALWRRGIALLLWRCPLCHTEDALVHERPMFRAHMLRCQACGARWQVHHLPGMDFRLQVVQGPPDLIGVEMSLSDWYDEMKRNLSTSAGRGLTLASDPKERILIEASEVTLLPRLPNPLVASPDGREPPRTQPPFKAQIAGWGKIGKGRLVLTEERLIWQGPSGELDFWWRDTTSVSLWMLNTLTLRYGAAQYRFELGQENGLKWLAYAALQAQRAAAQTGRKLNTSPF